MRHSLNLKIGSLFQVGSLLNPLLHVWVAEPSERQTPRNTIFAGTTRYISPTGLDANSGLTPELPKKTLTAAYSVSANGDIIQMLDGTYQSTDEAGGYLLLNTSTKGVLIKGNSSDRSAVSYNQSGAGTFCVRMRDSGECRFKDMTFQSNMNNSTVNIDTGYGDTYFRFDNCVLKNTNANSSASPVNILNSNVDVSSKEFDFIDCHFEKSGSAVPLEMSASHANHKYILENCTFNNSGQASIFVKDGSKGNYYLYNCNFLQNSNNPILIVGTDTSVPVSGVTGVFDMRSCDVLFSADYRQHAVLFGRGSDKITAINNKIVMGLFNDPLAIGLVLKTRSSDISNNYIAGNYVVAPRPFYIKGGSNITAKYNSCITNYVGLGNVEMKNTKELDLLDLNCNGNIIKYNNFIGGTFGFLCSSITSEDIDITVKTCDINDNKHNFIEHYINSNAINIEWVDKATYWGVSNNENGSSLINPKRLPMPEPSII